MARASSCLSALFLMFFCFFHCCMSSIDVCLAVSLSLHLPFSHPSAILVFPGAASIGDSPLRDEPSEAVPDRSKAHSRNTGRVSSNAMEVLPLRRNITAGTASLTTNFSFQIIPYPSSPSSFAWTVPHVYGQNVGLLPFPADTTTNWKSDRRSVVVDSPAFCLYDESTGINITTYCRLFVTNLSLISATGSRRYFGGPLPYEPKTRRLLPGRATYDRRATRKHHAEIRIKRPWLKQAALAGSALVGLICAVAGLVLCCIRIKRPLQSTAATELENDDEHIIREFDLQRGLGPRQFRYSDLAAATDNFAEERKIGRGGFGPVFRGYFTDQDLPVAIKVLSQEQSVQGLKEFQAEVTIMSQLRHRNIVRFVGWCGRRGGLALVYELMSGGSLDAHLYNPDRHLTWPQRYKIALQLGSALRYLHTDCDQCVVHGDIKPANIMLDASLNAKLGDFGLARLVDHGAEPQTTQVVAGTVGYIDPEFVSSRRPSAESDVYSYGVVLLEIACGRRPTKLSDQVASATLLASVRDMYRRHAILEAADRRLDGEFDEMEMERLLVTGLWCAQQDPVRRPSVAQAVDVLRSEDVKLPVLGAMAGSGEIRALEGQAYADLTSESSAYLDDESTETAYLTTDETSYLFPKE